MKKVHKTKLMINITDKVKQDKNRRYCKIFLNRISRNQTAPTYQYQNDLN